ncbi:MAG TPA: MMPL family transporter, partial [Solirubrobacterales bacterium]|nr:MMPL family transporter [Solirubrobacterales bacterium]
ALQDTTKAAAEAGFEVAVGGNAFGTTGVAIGATEFIGVAVAVLVLVLTFGSLLAAGMNLLTAGVGIAVGMGGLLLTSNVVTLSSTAPTLALMIGLAVGIDYTLFILSRHRTQLAAGLHPEESAARAVGTAGSAVVFAGLTVVIALSGLAVVGIPFLTVMGVGAAGTVLVAVLVALTLLPALLAILGSRAFWPRATGAAGSAAGPRRWARIAGFVRRRPRAIVATVFVALAVLALGNFIHHGTLGFGEGETRSTELGRGTQVLDEHFPPGIGSPLTAVVGLGEAEAALHGLEDLDSVKLAVPVPPSSLSDVAALAIVLRGDPYSSEAAGRVKGIRERLQEVAPSAVVGGIPAENYDVEQTNERDTRLIVPIVLLVVGLILVAVLRALAAPAYLTLTVVASFAATLGLVTFAFAELFGSGATSFNLVLLAFIFLVALGVDYNIFLMTRAREEAVVRGTREGMLVALQDTGAVVTGAGLILAGTFATLVLLPLEALVQIGATVAIGVLLDTFVVRSLLIPAITYLLGERAWWPSRAR